MNWIFYLLVTLMDSRLLHIWIWLWRVFTLSRETQMTKAMAAMLVSLTFKIISLKIILYGDTNMAAMTSSANTPYNTNERYMYTLWLIAWLRICQWPSLCHALRRWNRWAAKNQRANKCGKRGEEVPPSFAPTIFAMFVLRASPFLRFPLSKEQELSKHPFGGRQSVGPLLLGFVMPERKDTSLATNRYILWWFVEKMTWQTEF